MSRRETYTCAWAARLQNIWNQVLFEGEPRVRVTNIATGGTSSDIANIALKYQLLPEGLPMPHIVLLAHSANDVQHKNDDDEVLFQHMQDIVQSAHKLRYCDADLPLVVLVDDFYGGLGGVYKPVEQSSRVHAIAKWYQLMSISIGNVVGHELYSRNVEQGRVDPLAGSTLTLHMGTGYHIGLAWTVMYSFLTEIVDACYQDPSSGIQASTHLEHWWPTNTNTTEERAVLTLDEMETRGAPSKYIGYMKKETTEQSMLDDWKARLVEKEVRCQVDGANFSASPNINTTRFCEYAWMSNRVTGIEWPRDIDRVLKPKLTHVDGWVADGYPIRHPRTGWYAKKENATFSLKILVSDLEVSALTVVIMQSYGPTFVGTTLSMTVRIERGAVVGGNYTSTTDLQASYEVSGYHDIQTSVHVPFTFPIPGGAPAQVGDTIFFDASLTSGDRKSVV